MTPSEAAAGKELQPQSSCLPGENNVDTVQRPTESKRSRCAPDRELHTVQRSTRSRGLPDRQLHRVLRSTRSRGPHGPEVYTVQRSTRSGGLHGPEVHAVQRLTESRGPQGPTVHRVHSVQKRTRGWSAELAPSGHLKRGGGNVRAGEGGGHGERAVRGGATRDRGRCHSAVLLTCKPVMCQKGSVNVCVSPRNGKTALTDRSTPTCAGERLVRRGDDKERVLGVWRCSGMQSTRLLFLGTLEQNWSSITSACIIFVDLVLGQRKQMLCVQKTR